MSRNTAPAVCLHDVNHYFGEGSLRRQILFNVTAEIATGEIVIVMGPSGSGKTTMLTLVGALRSATSGSVRVLGTELSGASSATLVRARRDIGFIFQQRHWMILPLGLAVLCLSSCLQSSPAKDSSPAKEDGASRSGRPRAFRAAGRAPAHRRTLL